MRNNKPSLEDVLELSGIEVLHPGGFALSKRIGDIVNLKDKDVLDVSCGRGVFACYYAKKFGARVTGVDISPEMIKAAIAKARQEGVECLTEFKVADSLELPFTENSFDVVINECAVGLTSDPQKCLSEMVRVTKPGGYIVIHESVWLKELPEDEKRDIAERLGTVPFTLSEWRNMLSVAGADDIWDEDWSGIDKMAQIRPGRQIRSISDLFSVWEKVTVVLPRVIKRFGLRGLLYLQTSQRKITPLYLSGAIGYCLIRGKKQTSGRGAGGNQGGR